MLGSSSKADITAEWRSLLPFMADDELRSVLEERGAAMLAARLREAGLAVRLEAAPLDLVAEVLADLHGDPMRLIDGEPLVRV